MKVIRMMCKSFYDTPIQIICHAMEFLEQNYQNEKCYAVFHSSVFYLLSDLIFQ